MEEITIRKKRTMEEAISTLVFAGWTSLPRELLDLILEKLIDDKDYTRFSVVCKHWRSAAIYQKLHRSCQGWASLPWVPLHLILEKLILIADYIRFGGVCKHWRSVALYQKQHRLRSCHKQLPLLMVMNYCDKAAVLFSVRRDNNTNSYELDYEGKISCFEKSCGYSHGQLAYADNKRGVVILLDPFTRCYTRLPPIKQGYGGGKIVKVVLSRDPRLFSNGYEAVAMIGFHKLAHFKSGEDAWTVIDNIGHAPISDLIYYEGQFLAINERGRVILISISKALVFIRTENLGITFAPQLQTSDPSVYEKRLVESSGGDLMMVVRDFNGLDFKVYKMLHLDGDERKCKWAEIQSVGEDALFLSDHQAMCISASGFSDCRRDSIYLVLENGVAIFDLGNRTVEWQVEWQIKAKWISPRLG